MDPFFSLEYSEFDDGCDYVGEGGLDRVASLHGDLSFFQVELLQLLVQFDVKPDCPFDLRSGTEKLVRCLGRFQGSYLRGQGGN